MGVFMIRRDYHHYSLQEAIRDAESLIAGIRMTMNTEYCEFIVGHGIIKDELISLLKAHGLEPTIQLGNSGVVLCEIE